MSKTAEATKPVQDNLAPHRRFKAAQAAKASPAPKPADPPSTAETARFQATVPGPIVKVGMKVVDIMADGVEYGFYVVTGIGKDHVIAMDEDSGKERLIAIEDVAAAVRPLAGPSREPESLRGPGIEATVEDTAVGMMSFPGSAREPLAIALKIQQVQVFSEWMSQSNDSDVADKEQWAAVASKLQEAFTLAWLGAKGEVEYFKYDD